MKVDCKCDACGTTIQMRDIDLKVNEMYGRLNLCSRECYIKSRTKNYSGEVVGYLTVIEVENDISKRKWKKNGVYWRCICKCGNEVTVAADYISSGNAKSCGCKKMENFNGKTDTPEYRVWSAMKHRCYNINNKKYQDYGGRGIKVCQEWLNSFNNFLVDMGERPSDKHSIDREDVNGDYTKDNCRWVTQDIQSRNKRNNHWIEYNGTRMILKDWANYFGVNRTTLLERVQNGQKFDYIFNFYKQKNGLVNDNA